jgi:hypothetical protein
MLKMDSSNKSFEGALIVNGLIPEDDLWNGLKDLLNEIEDLPQPFHWYGLSAWELHISVHRKNRNGDIAPPLKWAGSALASPGACAAIAFRCKPFGDELDQDLSIGITKCLFRDLVLTFTFAANIAQPGCFGVRSIITRCSDGSFEEETGITHDLDSALGYSRKTGWPPLVPVPFGSVYIWIVRNLFHLRHGDTPVSRAFNAYTWLFGKAGSDFPFRLVSALIGIEALFATTTSGVTDQVRRRAQILLGNRTSFKKDLDKMYAARSAFLHGSTLLPANGFSWEPPNAIENKLEKIFSAENIASAVLLSSLQRLVEKDWTSLEFSENLMGSNNEEPQSIKEVVQGISIPYAYPSQLNEWMARFVRRFD